MIKDYIITTILLFFTILVFGQEKEHLYFLETDPTWQKEMFLFPIRFAPDINYKGVEDARFPAGWRKQDSSEFWSYVFAWNIDLNEAVSEKALEDNLKIYFDGLMSKDNTIALFLKKEETNNTSSYIGKVKTFDSFFTKKPMTLNVMVDKLYCEQKKKTIIVFRFSPQEFGHEVWLKLAEAKLPTNVCEL